MTTNHNSSIAFKSVGAMNVPCLSFSSSLKLNIPFCFKPKYRWFVKLLQVSSSLKLRKISYFHGEEEEEDDEKDDGGGIKAIKEMAVLEQ